MRQLSGADPECIFFMEVLPIVVVTVLPVPFMRDMLLCAATDNTGAAFSINKLGMVDDTTTHILMR